MLCTLDLSGFFVHFKMSATSKFIEDAIRRNKSVYDHEDLAEEMENAAAPKSKKYTWTKKADAQVSCLPHVIPGNLTKTQLDTFLLYARLEDVNRVLAQPKFNRKSTILSSAGLADESEVTSVEDIRLKARLETERTKLTELIMKINPRLRHGTNSNSSQSAPSGASLQSASSCVKHGSRWHERIWIPAEEFPQINFVGLLIGPRGNTLKRMESESGAKISIRGKGAEKEGKIRNDGNNIGMDEELHCMIMGDTEAKVKRAVEMVNRIIEKAASSPEAENEMKQTQLRELAILNGTLRDGAEVPTCSNCGAVGHRKYECPERKNVAAALICRICGGSGHTTSDCIHKNNPQMIEASKQQMMHIENEYMNFVSEINAAAGTPNTAPPPIAPSAFTDANASYYYQIQPPPPPPHYTPQS